MPRILLLALMVPAAALAADWPQWRGPLRDNVWPEKNLPDRLPEKLTPRWSQPLGGGYGGIAVSQGKLFVMDRQKDPAEVERVLSLDPTSGKTLWQHRYPVNYARYLKDGYGNGPRSTPTVHEGKVYTFGALGDLHCFEATTGKILWHRDTRKDFDGRVPTWGHACSPLVEGGHLVVQVGGRNGAALVALALDTGKEIWRSLEDPPGYSSPVIVETPRWRHLVYFTPRSVVGMEPGSGKVLWRVPFEGIEYDVAISDVVYADGVLLASNYWSGSKAIRLDEDGRNPQVVWEGKTLSLLMATPLVRGKHVYALDRARGLICLEMATGKVQWEGKHVTPRDRNPHASFAWVGNDRAVIFNTPGDLLLVELTSGGLVNRGKASVVGKTWAAPAFAGGAVYARTDSEIVCVPLGTR